MSRSFCDLHPKEEFCPTEIFNFNTGGLIHVDSLTTTPSSSSCKKNQKNYQQQHCCNHHPHLPQLFGQSINIEVDSCVPVPVQLPASIKNNIKQNLKNLNQKHFLQQQQQLSQAFSSSCCHFHHHHHHNSSSPQPPSSKQQNQNGNRNDIVFTRLELKLKEKTRKKLQEKMESSTSNNTTNGATANTTTTTNTATATNNTNNDNNNSATSNNNNNLESNLNNNNNASTPNNSTSKSSKRNKSRTNSNDSNIGNSESNSSSCNSINNNNNNGSNNSGNNHNHHHHHHHNHHMNDDVCTLLVDCQCKLCLQKQKLREELIAEEESSKKKKQKRKKKRSGKAKKETVVIKEEDEDEEEEEESSNTVNNDTTSVNLDNISINNNCKKKDELRDNSITIDTSNNNTNNKSNNTNNKSKSGNTNQSMSNCDSNEHNSNNDDTSWSKSDDSKPNSPRLVNQSNLQASSSSSSNGNNRSNNNSQDQSGLDQWIKVKSNKSKHSGGGSGEHESTSGKRRGNLSEAFEAEASGSPGGSGRRRNSNDDPSTCSLSSLMDSINLSEFAPIIYNKSSGSGGLLAAQMIAASHKAKLLAMDANLAFLRGDLKEALDLIDEAIELDPKCCPFYINRSYYYSRLEQYSNALKDANRALKLDENEEFVDHSSFRKAKALIGLERYTNAESALNSIKKWYRLRHNHERALSQLLLVEKELLLLRLKVLVSQDYTLPLARLYALKFGSIKSALAAIETNCQTLIGSGDIDLSLHLKLIDESQSSDGVTAADDNEDTETVADEDEQQLQQSTVYNSNCLIKALGSDVDTSHDSNEWSNENEVLKNQDNNRLDGNGDEDDEIYFSDDDEYDMFYSHPDKWSNPKEILKLKHNYPFIPPDAFNDPINSKGQRALWIGNVWPKCSIDLVTNLFMKFGNVTFCKIFYFPNETMNDVAYLLLHYDNGISPRLVMAFFKDKIIPGISKDNLPLVIRFRNKSDKLSEDESMSVASGGGGGATSASIGSNQNQSIVANSGLSVSAGFTFSPALHHQSSSAASPGVSNLNSPTSGGGGGFGGSISGSLSSTNSPANNNKTIAAECYYWRTTGCDRERCQFRHIPPSKGIDRQSWMRRKN